ncbi:hypothetical protein [Acinetobacter pseudolwoffii]|uniref:hypothetical protein n=1 Tax=Acinetobacter pseudolwoffii TaxID=2053287 RepID=UPI001BC879E8|nr:hypothetical protein [Acinetobacter pseudolwoffii]
MTMFLAPYTAIADIDGSPLDAGFLFFGEYGKDPELFPVEVFWDADFTMPAAQPIRTRNGYPVRNGSPTKVYFKTAQHSIVIKNRNGAFILVDFENKGWSADFVVDASGKTQQEINDLTGAPHRVKVGGYNIGERVVLENGDIVKSAVDGNTVDPNVDMTGWKNQSEHNNLKNRDVANAHPASAIQDASGKNQQQFNDEVNDQVNFLTGSNGKFRMINGVPVERNSIITLGRGSYSWWCEPNVNLLSGLNHLVAIGCVGKNSSRVHFASPSSSHRTVATANMVTDDLGGNLYKSDEHNSPVTYVWNGDLYVFYTGHADDGRIWMSKANGLDVNSLSRPVVIYTDPSNAVSYIQVVVASNKLHIFYRATPTKWNVLYTSDGVMWDARNVVSSAGTQQMYFRVTTSDAAGMILKLICMYHPTLTADNRIWVCNFNTSNMKITGSGGAVLADLTSADNAPAVVTSMIEAFTPAAGQRVRLFDVQRSTNSNVKMLVAVYQAGSSAAQYRYLEYDYINQVMIKDSFICNSGEYIGDGYHAGCSFGDVSKDFGDPAPSPILSIRESDGDWILEAYSSPDNGVTWAVDRVVRTTTGGVKMWRPRVPFNQRWQGNYQQFEAIWNEGTFTSYTDYDSTIMALLSVSNPV